MATTKIAIFRKREIRKTIHNNEWWFVLNDVVSTLNDSPNVQDYIKTMRKRDNELSKGWGQIITPLSVKTSGGDQKGVKGTVLFLRMIWSARVKKACLQA